MIIIIDNYDSFTYNLVQYVGSINPDIEIYRNDKISIDEIINKYNSEFKVVPENMKKYFDKKILKTSNIKTVKLNHAELEFLKLKGLLDEETIKPLYIK